MTSAPRESSNPASRAPSSSSRILCLGEVGWDRLWVVDHLPQGESNCHLISESGAPGGCALNTACVLGALGARVALAGNPVGADALGDATLGYLEKRGIETHILRLPGYATALCQVLVEEKTARRSFVLSHSRLQDEVPEALAALGPLVAETREGRFSHAFVQPYVRWHAWPYLRAVQDIPKDRAPWILIQDVPAQSEFVPLTDAVQVSLSDIYRREEPPELTAELAERIARPYFHGRCREVLVTAGPQGVAYVRRDAPSPELFAALESDGVVDTTGCGDAFRAGLIAALARGAQIRDAIVQGQEAGLRKARVYGSHF